jgi:putative DNA primase/helicase
LNWAVQGCLAWQREGLRPPDEVSAATKEYREAEDVLADFLAERCGFDGCAYVERGELFVAYEAWAAEHGEKYPMNRRNFYENIRRREGVSEKEQKISGSKERLFVGIGLVNT